MGAAIVLQVSRLGQAPWQGAAGGRCRHAASGEGPGNFASIRPLMTTHLPWTGPDRTMA